MSNSIIVLDIKVPLYYTCYVSLCLDLLSIDYSFVCLVGTLASISLSWLLSSMLLIQLLSLIFAVEPS